MRKLLLILYTVLFLFVPPIWAQVSDGSTPYSFRNNVPKPEVIEMPFINVPELLNEDKSDEMKGVPLRFGKEVGVNLNLKNSGTWTNLPNGAKLWRLQITSPEAVTLNLIYNDFYIPSGAKFHIYNINKTEVIGAFTERNNKEDGMFATSLIRGESCILEYYEPADVFVPGRIGIEYVVHGYRNVFDKSTFDFGESGSCQNNVNCYQQWKDAKQSVAMILTANNTRICTGLILNNAQLDFSPLLLTANHCYASSPSTWIIMFNYESQECSPTKDGPLNYTVQGTNLKARLSKTDFVLLELNEEIPDSFNVYYSGWDTDTTAPVSGVSISHPNGDVKKITLTDKTVKHSGYTGINDSTHWQAYWTSGATEEGSSGAPFFDQNGLLRGQLHGGPSGCGATANWDFFGKFSLSYSSDTSIERSLKKWLDPNNVGLTKLQGSYKKNITPDTTPPDFISDLSIVNINSNSIEISWSAPLDSSLYGVVAYDIRISGTTIIDRMHFESAKSIPFTQAILSAGSKQVFKINNLNASTKYFLRIIAKDIFNNTSDFSNQIEFKTLATPNIQVSNSEIELYLQNGLNYSDTITISNIAKEESTLEYEVKLGKNSFPLELVASRILPFEDDKPLLLKENKTEKGMSVKKRGGPDKYGYVWFDSEDEEGPKFEWNDIKSTGTEITNWIATSTFTAKDDGYWEVILPFTFNYYGIDYNAVYVSTNGYITFTKNDKEQINTSLPDVSKPNNVIAPLWEDLNLTISGRVFYKHHNGNFIIQYDSCAQYRKETSRLTFQVVLNPEGKIYFYYKEMVSPDLTLSSIGIEDSAGTDGLQISYHAPYVKNNLAVHFIKKPDWFTGNEFTGILRNNSHAKIVFDVATKSFKAGNYQADLTITSNDPDDSVIIVPVKLNIYNPTHIESFSSIQIENDVIINWTTGGKVYSGFTIERTKPGSTNWIKVGEVNGSTFSIKDNNLKHGEYLYRIIMHEGSLFEITPDLLVEVKLPESFTLKQNYPNPFNLITKIEFTLPVKTDVSLSIYNSIGQVVKQLINGEKEEGYYEVAFDGSGMPSGIYYYRLTAGSFTQTKKMVLIK